MTAAPLPMPFFKYAGGKSRFADIYSALIFGRLPRAPSRFLDPFFGSGAMSALARRDLGADVPVVASDTNEELVSAYLALRDDDHEERVIESYVIEAMNMSHSRHKKKCYLAVRDAYCHGAACDTYKAALLFLMARTCFNGIWNAHAIFGGKFSTGAGDMNFDPRWLCDRAPLVAAAAFLRTISLRVGDFETVEPLPGDLLYLDPPYRTRDPKAAIWYLDRPFLDDEQERLAKYAVRARDAGCMVALSINDLGDGFLEARYPGFTVERVPGINHVAHRRGVSRRGREVVVMSYGESPLRGLQYEPS